MFLWECVLFLISWSARVCVCYIVSVSSFLMFKEFCVLWTTFDGMCDFMFRCVCVWRTLLQDLFHFWAMFFISPHYSRKFKWTVFHWMCWEISFHWTFRIWGDFFACTLLQHYPPKSVILWRSGLKLWICLTKSNFRTLQA